MMGAPRSSLLRALIGCGLLLAALAVAGFVLPDASDQALQKRKAAREAQSALTRELKAFSDLQLLAEQLQNSRTRLESLLSNLPQEGPGRLNWRLSERLNELAKTSGIRLQSVKYSQPTREGAKGTDLEAMDVEFTATGLYASLKPFMLALEGSDLPFAVVSARLEESPEGARLGATLRAFRRAGAAPTSPAGEEP